MTVFEELETARAELVLLMATMDASATETARTILGRIERALETLRGHPSE
jgi:hypothetical protein